MKLDKEKFSKLFADQLNRLDLAFDVLAAGLENGYGGQSDFTLIHSQSAFISARLDVSSSCELTWGNGWSDWSASGQIEWSTSSNHYVRFEFSREQYGEIELNQVVIGDDSSESFYPWITNVCAKNNIPLVIEEAQPQEEEIEVAA